MRIIRAIAPTWLLEEDPTQKRVHEGVYTDDEINNLNSLGYNIYFLPNHPTMYEGGTVDGFQIDTFQYVFVDMDLKEGVYKTKEDFYNKVLDFPIQPTIVNDSGNGIHVYWMVDDLDAHSYLRLQRRLMRYFKTDEAVCKIYQLMRLEGTVNTKNKDDLKICETLLAVENIYTCEELDKVLPPITLEDERYCEQHYNKTYRINTNDQKVDEKIPLKFAQLLDSNTEVKDIWCGNIDDRSKGDFRLGHIMFASGFTKDEAASVLVNSAKALQRAPLHRINYAQNIVDKIWTFEITANKEALTLSNSVKDILLKSGNDPERLRGERFPCWKYLDNTENGFRLGHVLGFVAGSGVGKTAVCLNMFKGFVQFNPNYEHFFVSLEQSRDEIALRWKKLCGNDTQLHDKVHIIDNWNEDGTFRDLNLKTIKDYILKFQQVTGKKAGCVVIDHIGVLSGKGSDLEVLIQICKEMKPFAKETNTLLIMQSQAPREKAGIGDLELDKDAAYGTSKFENFVDYLVSMWQPLKRCYNEGAPTVTALKFCKIRHKNQKVDVIQEDTPYKLLFDPETETLRELTQDEDTAFTFFLNKATNKRKLDKKTDLVQYSSMKS
jgi:KaiC/GvpD/RAD55 family RecA-like ATPase